MEIKPVSYIWQRLLEKNQIPKNGVVVEVAPGYEKKIGDALALLGFTGTIILIEPDKLAAAHVKKLYKKILPLASVKVVTKFLQDVQVGCDIPAHIDALLANHPFDDMVIAFAMHGEQPALFSREREDGIQFAPDIKKMYDALSNKDYIHGILATMIIWKDFVQKLKPDLFIANQYPSHKLTIKKLEKRQNSGFIIIELIREYYESYLKHLYMSRSFGQQGDPAWWIIAGKPYTDLIKDLEIKPAAIQRLGSPLFVPQRARHLNPTEYDVVYVDHACFKNCGYEGDAVEQIRNFAIVLENKNRVNSEAIIVYADRQKDSTGIGLSGNSGSGRAVYYGKKFNIMGVGKTTLCTSSIPSHSSGTMEIIGALRRVVLSRWINHFTGMAVKHLAVIALKKTETVKWNQNPIPLALLVRIDDGTLDRPSHIEFLPKIKNDFQKSLMSYAKLDAQNFAYRIILGAWSTGNYSVSGHMIDLETASFVKYRGPYNTTSKKHQEDYFGYESLGFIKILEQMAVVKKIRGLNIKKLFYDERQKHLALCLLLLLGIDEIHAETFLSKHNYEVTKLSKQFERLAKKINQERTDLNLYDKISEYNDPALLDMSNLFQNLKKLLRTPNREKRAMEYLLRKNALQKIKLGMNYIPKRTSKGEINHGEFFIKENAVITYNELKKFVSEVQNFVHNLFQLLDKLDAKKYIPKGSLWNDGLRIANRSFPTINILNDKLKYWVEEYRLGRINPDTLNVEIEKLCDLPEYPTGKNFELRDIPLIEYLNPNRSEQNFLSKHVKIKDYKNGETVVSEGDVADSLFVLVQGTCRVFVNGIEIAKINNRGAIIGEAVVFEKKGRKRTATVITETPTRLLQIDRHDLEKMKVMYPKLRRLLANVLLQRKTGVGDKIHNLEIFNGIDPENITLFFADKAEEKKLNKNGLLIKQGRKTAGVFALTHGSVTLSQVEPDSKINPIELEDKPLNRGLFGERSAILDEKAICSVIANENIKTLFIKKNDFNKFINRHPQLLRNCLSHITDYSRSNKKRISLVSKLEKRIFNSDQVI